MDPDCAGGALLDWCTWLDFRPWKTKQCSLIFQNKTVRDFSWLVLSCEEPLLALFYRTVSLDAVSPTPREVNFITELTQ